MLFKHIDGDETDDEQNAERHNDQIVEVAQDWDKVRYQIDGTESIGCVRISAKAPWCFGSNRPPFR
jgi:hypothetical protein